MAEQELDALVVRAPDNVLYLTNFWGMKGYDAVVFPREGEPTLIASRPRQDDAARTAWTDDVRFIRGYDEADPRPPLARTTRRWRRRPSPGTATERVGLELSLGTQASDRMVGEPTTFTQRLVRRVRRRRGRRDAAARAARARSRPSRSSSACGSRTRSRPRAMEHVPRASCGPG